MRHNMHQAPVRETYRGWNRNCRTMRFNTYIRRLFERHLVAGIGTAEPYGTAYIRRLLERHLVAGIGTVELCGDIRWTD